MQAARVPDEPRATRLAEPDEWWRVDRVVVRRTRLSYGLGQAEPLRDEAGRYRRDERGRVALEAFMGLPITAMYQRLDGHLASVAVGGQANPSIERDAFGELVAFVERFGPLGLEWARVHPVENPEADRLAHENDGLKFASRGLFGQPDSPSDPSEERAGAWRVILPWPGTLGTAKVERAVSFPALELEDRVRFGDDALPHDELGPASGGPLVLAHQALDTTMRFADALARTNEADVRQLLETHVLRVPAHWRWDAPRGSIRTEDRAEAAHRSEPAGSSARRNREEPESADWLRRGRRALAQLLSRELTTSSIGVGVRGDRLALGWRIRSLIEFMHLQLLEHLQRHPDFGIGTCRVCGMPILRVRRIQHYHSGCAPVGRQRESRAARRRGQDHGGD